MNVIPWLNNVHIEASTTTSHNFRQDNFININGCIVHPQSPHQHMHSGHEHRHQRIQPQSWEVAHTHPAKTNYCNQCMKPPTISNINWLTNMTQLCTHNTHIPCTRWYSQSTQKEVMLPKTMSHWHAAACTTARHNSLQSRVKNFWISMQNYPQSNCYHNKICIDNSQPISPSVWEFKNTINTSFPRTTSLCIDDEDTLILMVHKSCNASCFKLEGQLCASTRFSRSDSPSRSPRWSNTHSDTRKIIFIEKHRRAQSEKRGQRERDSPGTLTKSQEGFFLWWPVITRAQQEFTGLRGDRPPHDAATEGFFPEFQEIVHTATAGVPWASVYVVVFEELQARAPRICNVE